MVPNMSVPMAIIPMVEMYVYLKVCPVWRKRRKKNTISLGNIYNKNISLGHYTYHLFCLVLQFRETLKQLAKAAFILKAHFGHMFKSG